MNATAARLFSSCTAALAQPARFSASHVALRQTRRAVPFMARSMSGSANPSEDAAPADASKTETADDCAVKLKAKEEEVADLTSRLRYAQADYINLQRISKIEKDQIRDYAISKFAADLIGTVDTLALAISSTPPPSSSSSSEPPAYFSPNNDSLRTGVELTQRQLLSTLAKYGVTPFDPKGEKFDPNWHEAMYQATLPDKESGTVLATVKVGYKIKERCLRAAQVGVVA